MNKKILVAAVLSALAAQAEADIILGTNAGAGATGVGVTFIGDNAGMNSASNLAVIIGSTGNPFPNSGSGCPLYPGAADVGCYSADNSVIVGNYGSISSGSVGSVSIGDFSHIGAYDSSSGTVDLTLPAIHSVAVGMSAWASATNDIATGYRAMAGDGFGGGVSASVYGAFGIASATGSTGVGYAVNASGDYSFAGATFASASGLNGIALGYSALNSGMNSAAIGSFATDDGLSNVVSFGNGTLDRRIIHILDGIASSDAATVRQVNAALAAANLYTDNAVAGLGGGGGGAYDPATVVLRDGTNSMTGNLNLANNRISNVGAAISGDQAVNLAQVQSMQYSLLHQDDGSGGTASLDVASNAITQVVADTNFGKSTTVDLRANGYNVSASNGLGGGTNNASLGVNPNGANISASNGTAGLSTSFGATGFQTLVNSGTGVRSSLNATTTGVMATASTNQGSSLMSLTPNSAFFTVTNPQGGQQGLFVTQTETILKGGTSPALASQMTLNATGATFGNSLTGAAVQLHNVAPGTARSDVATYGQLQDALAGVGGGGSDPAINNDIALLQQQQHAMKKDMAKMRKDLEADVAGANALASIVPAGKDSISYAIGGAGSQLALAVKATHRFSHGKVGSFGLSLNTAGRIGWGVSMSIPWNPTVAFNK